MILRLLTDIFFPERCLVCHRDTSARSAVDGSGGAGGRGYRACCSDCYAGIPVSGIPPAPRESDPPGFSFFIGSATAYNHPDIQKLVHALKFDRMRSAAEPLGDLLFAYASEARVHSAIAPMVAGANIIPLPLSKKRLRKRGFNQADLIAQRFGKRMGIPVAADTLVRARHTKPQSETASASERKENIRGCFAVKRAPPANIVLIDDVVTTGSTLQEAAKVLRAAGANHVFALTVAAA